MRATSRRLKIKDLYLYKHLQSKGGLFEDFGTDPVRKLFNHFAVKLFKRSKVQASETFSKIEAARFWSNNMDDMTKMYQVGVIKDKRTLFIARQISENNAHVARKDDGDFVLYGKYRNCPDEMKWIGPSTLAQVADIVEQGKIKYWRLVESDNTFVVPCSQKGFLELLALGQELKEAKETIMNNPQKLQTLVKMVKVEVGTEQTKAKKPVTSTKRPALEHKK